jgi:hypothetical protein
MLAFDEMYPSEAEEYESSKKQRNKKGDNAGGKKGSSSASRGDKKKSGRDKDKTKKGKKRGRSSDSSDEEKGSVNNSSEEDDDSASAASASDADSDSSRRRLKKSKKSKSKTSSKGGKSRDTSPIARKKSRLTNSITPASAKDKSKSTAPQLVTPDPVQAAQIVAASALTVSALKGIKQKDLPRSEDILQTKTVSAIDYFYKQ